MKNHSAFTEEDRKDLLELYLHPLNFPDYSTNEDIKNFFDLNIGGTVFIFILCVLIAMLDGVKWAVGIFSLWGIQFVIRTINYKCKRKKNKEKIINMVDTLLDNQPAPEYQVDGFIVGENRYLDKEWKRIVFYKHFFFAFSENHMVIVSLRVHNKQQIENFFLDFPEVELFEEVEAFQISKYSFNNKLMHLDLL